MDEELVKVLSNVELDDKGKAEAIQKMVEAKYVPATVVANERQANKKALADKDKLYTDLSAEYDTYKQSKMTEDEKRQDEANKKEAQYNEALKEISKTTAINVFVQAGLEEDDYKDFIEDIVGLDKEKSRTVAEKICATITKQKSAATEKMKDEFIDGATPPPAGNANYSLKTDLEFYQGKLAEAQKNGDIGNMVYYQRLVAEETNKTK